MFGNKSLMKRVVRAVEPCLEPGEQLIVPVYLHTYEGSDLVALLTGTALPGAGISTWIAALTDKRVLVFEGNSTNAAASRLLGAVPRADVTVTAEGKPDRPAHLTLVVRGDTGHRFAVPLVWRQDAARFVAGLTS